MAFLRQGQVKCAVYVNMYYYKVIVRGWKVPLLDGTVYVLASFKKYLANLQEDKLYYYSFWYRQSL